MKGSPRRILYVHNSADTYGASRSLLRLVTTIDRERFEPMVVLPQEGELSEQLRYFKVSVFIHPELTIISRYLKSPVTILRFLVNIPRSIWFLTQLIRQERIELVHTNVGVVPSAAMAAMLSGRPHVWHIREFFSEFGSLWRLYSRYITGFSHRVIAVSAAAANQFSNQEKVRVVYNGFQLDVVKESSSEGDQKSRVVLVDRFQKEQKAEDAESLRKKFRAQFNIENEVVAGCVGRIKFQRKGQDVFIRAIALLKQRGVAVRGLIVGAPFSANEQQWQAVKDLISEQGVEKEIILAGELKDVRPAYAAMDIFVLPSALPEPFGGVIMEAMGMRLPVIATNIGGSPEQVEEKVTGYLVPPNNPKMLADRILELSKDAALRVQLGSAGLERLGQRFSLAKTTKQMEQIYEEILTVGSSMTTVK